MDNLKVSLKAGKFIKLFDYPKEKGEYKMKRMWKKKKLGKIPEIKLVIYIRLFNRKIIFINNFLFSVLCISPFVVFLFIFLFLDS